MEEHRWFERLAESTEQLTPEPAPANLKSKVYSAVVANIAATRGLLDLRDTQRAGGHLCVFENAVAILPVGTRIRSLNPCQICHARVLGERMKQAPIFWPGCPYSEFHHG
jgi:hypothetical protein